MTDLDRQGREEMPADLQALTVEQRASLEASWVKAKRSNWPGEYDGFEAGYRAALAAREEPQVDNEDASSERAGCANPRCLNGANCPGHPWHEDELEQLDRLEAVSRDMNVAGHRGAGFRQAANFYRPQIARLAAREAPISDPRETPRKWTLANPLGTGMVVDGPEISLSEEVEVIERAAREEPPSSMIGPGQPPEQVVAAREEPQREEQARESLQFVRELLRDHASIADKEAGEWLDRHLKIVETALATREESQCPCGEPAPKGSAPCTFEKPCPYGMGFPRERWGNTRQVLALAELREALKRLVKWIDMDLDLSDEFSVEEAVPRELISCTRPKECWQRGDAVIKAARVVLAAQPGIHLGPVVLPPCCRYHFFDNTRTAEWNALTQEERTAIVAQRCDSEVARVDTERPDEEI